MKELGLRTRAFNKTRCTLPKARRKFSRGKSLLSKRESLSGSGESAAVHYAQLSFLSFSDDIGKSDDDPAVVRTVVTLPVAGSDTLALEQEKEARSSGGISSL